MNSTKTVNIEVSENQHNGYSLLISNEYTGHRLAGAKVGGCDSVADFDISVAELHQKLEEFGEISPTRQQLIDALQRCESALGALPLPVEYVNDLLNARSVLEEVNKNI